jgi:hypothetical protein
MPVDYDALASKLGAVKSEPTIDYTALAAKNGAVDSSSAKQDGMFDNLSYKNIPQNLCNLAAGAVRGAGSIGSTLVAPYDIAKDAIEGKGLSLESNRERRAGIDDGLRQLGANPDSGEYKIGKIGGEIAGTAGAGGLLGNLVGKVAPNAVGMASALKNVGFAKDANLATNIVGGAVPSALSSLIIEPDLKQAGISGAIGGALPLAGKVATKVGGYVADAIGGMVTHTGGESLRTAARVGMEGGENAKTFADNMRGKVDMTDVLDTAKSNLSNMSKAKSEAYKNGMIDVANDKSVLSFKGIDDAVDNALNAVSFKGQIRNAKGADVQSKIAEEVANWKNLNPSEFHTPEGLDALKQKIGSIVESIPFEERTARKVGGDIYNSIKGEITKQAPTYANTMKGYSESSKQISEIEKALSLGNKASVDTAMRKLQSLTRNNVSTNYGNRLDLAKALQTQGGKDIMPALAGQSLSSFTPRGLGSAVAGATGVAGLATLNPYTLPALAMQSPRLMGEAALKTGQMAKVLSNNSKSISKVSPALINALKGND